MPVMAVAALIVAILAFVAAAYSAWYARDVARTERDRRLEERAPKITPRLRQLPDPGSPWVLELLLDHETPSGPLADVSVTITRFTDARGGTYPAGDMYLGGGRPGAKFAREQNGVSARKGFDPLHAARWASADGKPLPLRPGESACWQVELHETPSRPARLDTEVACRASDGSRWTLALPVEVPRDPTKTIW
jgi:hypothetical protein